MNINNIENDPEENIINDNSSNRTSINFSSISQNDNNNNNTSNNEGVVAYTEQEYSYISKYTNITLSFLLIFLINISLIIINKFYEIETYKFTFQYESIYSHYQFYRFITRYFIHYGICHFLLESYVTYLFCYYLENMLGTIITISLILVSMILISCIQLIILWIINYYLLFSLYSKENYLSFDYEGSLTPVLFSLYTYFFLFKKNNSKTYKILFIFDFYLKSSSYFFLFFLYFFTPNKSIIGNICGIFAAKCLKKFGFFLPKVKWIKDFENNIGLMKCFPLYRFISNESHLMKVILNEYNKNSMKGENDYGEDIENGTQMTELTLLSNYKENYNNNKEREREKENNRRRGINRERNIRGNINEINNISSNTSNSGDSSD